MKARWRRLALAALTAAVLGLVALLFRSSRPRGESAAAAATPPGGAPVASARVGRAAAGPAPATRSAPGAAAEPEARTMADGRPFWRPGQPHWYGPKADPFIRQPHDYAPGTPEKLGNRISEHLFDLERVQDMVSRGTDDNSEIARVRGWPLDEGELANARGVLQRFFDETVPVVDAVLGEELSRDAAYADIGPRRWRMNDDVRVALGLTEAQFAELWPHIGELAGRVHQLRD